VRSSARAGCAAEAASSARAKMDFEMREVFILVFPLSLVPKTGTE